MSDQTAWVCEGTGAGPSSTAWSGSSQAWHTIQIGPGSEICRSSRWRSPQSSQVMVTRIASAGWHCRCDGPRPRTSPPGYRPATNRRHPLRQGGTKRVEVPCRTCGDLDPLRPSRLGWSSLIWGSSAVVGVVGAVGRSLRTAPATPGPNSANACPLHFSEIASGTDACARQSHHAIVPRLRRSVPDRHG